MISGTALRHQMILPLQQSLYDYWRSKCKNGKLPSRCDINPSEIAGHLQMISLVDVCPQPVGVNNAQALSPRYKFRLAGTGFYDLFNSEITGHYIDDLPIGEKREYWDRVLTRVQTRGKPSAGVTRPGTPNKGHMAQFWIRLPLSDDGHTVSMILGYDHLVSPSHSEASILQEQKLSA